MSSQIQVLRVVVASPSDVQAERDLVPVVLDEINKSLGNDRAVRLEAVRWETDTYPGLHAAGPQGLIDPILRVDDCDLLIGIFWKRFGTPAVDGKTGTQHEFQTAYETWKKSGRPQVMVYFNLQAYEAKSKIETDQWGQVLEFRESFPREGLWWPYRGTGEFEKLLRMHLSNYLRSTFPISSFQERGPERGGLLATDPPAMPPSQPDYFAVQKRIIEEHSKTFVGRASTLEALQDFMTSRRKGYFIVRGGPGEGKTAFSSHLVKRHNYIHHFISRSGGRTDSRLILRSLISQMLPPDQKLAANPDSISNLTKMYEELLLELSNQGRAPVIVVDALDELPPESTEDPPYLVTETLPDGVFFIITLRPGARLERIHALLFGIPQELYDLEPLALDEMRLMLLSLKPEMTSAEIERIAEVSQGNPLYLRAVIDQLETEPTYDLRTLPGKIEGFYLNATEALGSATPLLHETLATLSAARTALSVAELSQITGHGQRQIKEQAIHPVRQFLIDMDGSYTFYHERFHEFVLRSLLYQDEMQKAHRRIADWLRMPENSNKSYRWSSLAYHLHASGNCDVLLNVIDETFLMEKAHQNGYAVLEDLELWARCLLAKGDASLIERCIAVVQQLSSIVGGDLVTEAVNLVQPYRSGHSSFRTRMITPSVPTVPGIDVYAAVLPKGDVSADFFEVVPAKDHLVIAIGDAPASGLTSAFVGRFIAMLFQDLITNGHSLNGLLEEIDKNISGYGPFQNVSMQCIDIDPEHHVASLVSAGHPFPVHYSASKERCDVLPIRGALLAIPDGKSTDGKKHQLYSLSVDAGDRLILISDGITEAHVLQGDPYGYRFTRLINTHARESARTLGEAIIDDWRMHRREGDLVDDVSIIVISFYDIRRSQ